MKQLKKVLHQIKKRFIEEKRAQDASKTEDDVDYSILFATIETK